jgi:GNAT superfamily N-acetyltransferase
MNLIACDTTHLATIIDLTKKIWPVAYGKILSLDQLEYMIAKFYNEVALFELMENGHVFYLAQVGNKHVGFVSYELNSEPNKTKIHKIYVLPEAQGTGVGRQFFELVKEKAQENRQKAIYLNVNKFNKARYFYENLGFSVVKEEIIPIGNNYVMDDYVMEICI